MSGAGLAANYSYNGLGDRLRQTANSVTTEYALDLASGLTQVLDDETNAYLYGVGRIGEEQPDGWQYYLGDALGSVRQLTDEVGDLSLVKSYLPYGEAITGAGGAASAYGYTGEWVDELTNLVFLRARWYAPQSGRFTTQDAWQGDIQNPLSFNKWLYGYANPINVSDPSGRNPCALSGTCGPDVTDWFRDEMRENYDYGKDMVTLVTKMKNHASYILAQASRCEIIYLKDLALEPPFTDIVSRFKVPLPNVNTPVGSIPVIGPDMADKLIDFLKLIEFGAYGLAVDYSEVKYDLTVGSCGDGCGWVTDDNGDPHRVISLCDRCVDSSDLGNIMFGLGGNVRGYDMISTYFWAAMFNAARDPFDSPIEIPINAFNSEDARGAFPGWTIGANHAYLSRGAFCSVIDSFRPIGYNDNADKIANCTPCSTETNLTVLESPQSLISRGAGVDTINKLNELRDTFYQTLWEKLIGE